MNSLRQRHTVLSKPDESTVCGTSNLKIVECLAQNKPRSDCRNCGKCDYCGLMSYGTFLSDSLMHMRDTGQLCDVILCTECGYKMEIHSILLAALSPLFRKLFIGGIAGKLLLPFVSPSVLRQIVHFAYTCEVKSGDDALELLSSAKRYGMTSLVNACEHFMADHVTLNNCIAYLNAANENELPSLEAKARKYIATEWDQVWRRNEDFVSLTKLELSAILEDDRLNDKNEAEVGQSIHKWVNFDISSRSEDLTFLFSKTRCNCTERCRDCPLEGNVDGECPNNYFRFRVPRSLLFSIAGWHGGAATSLVEVYDMKSDDWVLYPFLDRVLRAYHGVAILSGRIYIIGGYNGEECFRSMRCFDPVSGCWSECNSMNEARCYISTVTTKDHIYALGGYDGLERKSSCERFDVDSNQWTMISPMIHRRSDASAAEHKGKIVVCGGFDGNEIQNSSEIYDPDADMWTMIASLPGKRSGHKLIVNQCRLYFLGGFDGTNRLNDVYRFSETFGKWIEETPMKRARSNFAAAVLDGHIYVIGGFNGECIIGEVEYYDTDQHKWHSVKNLNVPRSASVAGVIENLSNVYRYTSNGPFGKGTVPEYNRFVSTMPNESSPDG